MQTTMLHRPTPSHVALGVAILGLLVGAFTAVSLERHPAPGSGRLVIDPPALAYVETQGWRAYYDRAWPRAIGLMLQLNHDQFGLGWPAAVEASYYATRAQMAFAGTDNNVPLARAYLASYYGIIARERGLGWDPQSAADAEMRYWIIHRQVAQAPGKPAPLVDALADLHALLFEIPPPAARASAVERTAAAQAVDRITGHRSLDVEADWREVEVRLGAGYDLIAAAMRQ